MVGLATSLPLSSPAFAFQATSGHARTGLSSRTCPVAGSLIILSPMDRPAVSGTMSPGLLFCRQVLHPLLAITALVCLLALVGWTGALVTWQHWLTVALGLAFVGERIWIFRILRPYGKERTRLGAHLLAAVVVAAVAIALVFQDPIGKESWPIGWHVFVQSAAIISGIASLLHHKARFSSRKVHPGWLLITSFFAAIAVGTLLLKMPRSIADGEHLSWLEAAFTSTSAVCVTGLVVENTATFFSPTGQVIILLLIQAGGLGMMTLTFFAAVVLFEGLSLHDRLMLGKMLQENRLSRINKTLTFIVLMTLVCEGIGAWVLFCGMDASLAFEERLFQSAFHSVSAFCNAGFSTLPDGMASEVVEGNLTWQFCIMALVVIGGLGALVVEDLSHWSLAKCKKLFRRELPRPRLRVHTRLVLAITGSLVFGGALIIYATEFLFSDGPANGGTATTALFHSITARTAGFNTVDLNGIAPLTVQILMVLMIIGGSPGGTAGGLRTTVVAVGLGHLWLQMRSSKRGMVAFNRKIPATTGARALGVMVLAAIWLGINFILLQIIETGSGISETRLFFELVSSFATVGLSLDVTAGLTEGGKALIILNMFVGRIGLLAVLAAMLRRDTRPASGKPEEDILLT
jgi:trk system potassium uptake protein